jgi:GT2 family glycosyltransferase
MTVKSEDYGICLVTVTYGERAPYVEKAVASAFSAGVKRVVVVDNGSSPPVTRSLKLRFGKRVSICRYHQNEGSAPAFKKGILLALQSNCESILLLDDDNILTSSCCARLRTALAYKSTLHGVDNCMVFAHRPGHVPKKQVGDTNAFLEFHVKDIPNKIKTRLGLKTKAICSLPERGILRVPHAPYSGLLFFKEVIEKHGLPDERFVLYADDSEFTYRVTAADGFVGLVLDAHLEEMEVSWSLENKKAGFIKTLAISASDFRVYYSTRNRCFLETHIMPHRPAVRMCNQLMFMCLLGLVCVSERKLARWNLIRRAIRDGKASQLGIPNDLGMRLP